MGGRRSIVAAVLAVVLPVILLGACSSGGSRSAPEPTAVTSVAAVDGTASGRSAADGSGGGCREIPSPDGMGCPAAQEMVRQMAAPLPTPLPGPVTACLVDKLQDLPSGADAVTASLRLGAIYDCEAFTVLGTLEQVALGLEGGAAQIDCLAGAIQGTGHDEFVAAIAAGPQSEAGRTLAEDYRDQCA